MCWMVPQNWSQWTVSEFLQWKTQQDATVYQNFIIPYFKWSSTCFGRHTVHHQEPKTAQAASGFAYVEGCQTCSCWTTSNDCIKTVSKFYYTLYHCPGAYTAQPLVAISYIIIYHNLPTPLIYSQARTYCHQWSHPYTLRTNFWKT